MSNPQSNSSNQPNQPFYPAHQPAYSEPAYGQQSYPQTVYQAPPPGFYPGNYQPPPPQTNALAVAGFILSLLGIGFLIPLLGWLAIPLVILGIVLSIIGLNKARTGAPFRGLAMAGLIIGALTFVGGIILNLAVYHNTTQNWTHVDEVPAPTGAQAEALVGEWAYDGTPWFRFNADGTGENLDDGERFNWHSDGTFSNAVAYQTWRVENDILTITWITGSSFSYTRIGN